MKKFLPLDIIFNLAYYILTQVCLQSGLVHTIPNGQCQNAPSGQTVLQVKGSFACVLKLEPGCIKTGKSGGLIVHIPSQRHKNQVHIYQNSSYDHWKFWPFHALGTRIADSGFSTFSSWAIKKSCFYLDSLTCKTQEAEP